MKHKILVFFLLIGGFLVRAQESFNLPDTVNLEEIIVKAVRADKKAPFAQTIVESKDIEPRNLAQDIPILLNYLPSDFLIFRTYGTLLSFLYYLAINMPHLRCVGA